MAECAVCGAPKMKDGKCPNDAGLCDRCHTVTRLECEAQRGKETMARVRMFLRGCLGHFYDETPIDQIAEQVSRAFHAQTLQAQGYRAEVSALRAQLAKAQAVVEAAIELADLMQGVIDGEYKPDSFTLQPIRQALDAYKAP